MAKTRTRLSQIIFLLFLFTFPFGEVIRISIGSAIIHPTDVILSLLLPVWIFEKKPTPSFFKKFKPIGIFVGILCLSLALHIFEYNSTVLSQAFLYTSRFAAYAFIYLIVFGFPKSFKKTISFLLVGIGFIIVALGFVQYFLYPNLRNLYYSGWDEHLYRMFTVFLDPNFAGAFFVCYLLFIIHVMPDLIRHLGFRLRIAGKVLLSFLLLVTLGAIVLTYSRSAYIMFVVSIIAYAFLLRQKKLLIGIAALLFIVILGVFVSPKSEGTNLLRTTSGIARIESLQNAITIWQENPIFGVGFDAYSNSQLQHGFIKPQVKENHAASGTDNSFLFLLATTGIIGLVLYLFMWCKILRKSNALIIATVVGLFVDSLFVNSLFYSYIMLWVWMVLGVTGYDLQ